jgi:flagellar basal body-associated protein FliL
LSTFWIIFLVVAIILICSIFLCIGYKYYSKKSEEKSQTPLEKGLNYVNNLIKKDQNK